MTRRTLNPAAIRIGERLRRADPAKVAALADSIAEIGLMTPVSVWEAPAFTDGKPGTVYELVAGLHRLEAVKSLGLAEIEAEVVGLDEFRRQLWEVDENLCRAELDPAMRAKFTARRKELYEYLHPETRRGVAGAHASNAAQGNASAKLAPAFTADTAARSGQSERSVQRDAERGEKVAEDVLDMLAGRPEATGAVLDRLKRLPPDQQRAHAKALLAGKAPKPIAPAREPHNDYEAVQKQVDSLMRAWNAAGPEAREQFLERIDRPVFDQTRAA